MTQRQTETKSKNICLSDIKGVWYEVLAPWQYVRKERHADKGWPGCPVHLGDSG